MESDGEGPARTHKDLRVWQKGVELVKVVYELTGRFPKSETYGLTMQLRRCAVSIPSNIAEGFGRHTDAEFARFLLIARGSLFELDTQALIARELGLMRAEDYHRVADMVEEEQRMLDPFIRHLQGRA